MKKISVILVVLLLMCLAVCENFIAFANTTPNNLYQMENVTADDFSSAVRHNTDVQNIVQEDGWIRYNKTNIKGKRGVFYFNKIALFNAEAVDVDGVKIPISDLSYTIKMKVRLDAFIVDSADSSVDILFRYEDRKENSSDPRGERRASIRLIAGENTSRVAYSTLSTSDESDKASEPTPTYVKEFSNISSITNKKMQAGDVFDIQIDSFKDKLSLSINDETVFSNIPAIKFPEVVGKSASYGKPALGFRGFDTSISFTDIFVYCNTPYNKMYYADEISNFSGKIILKNEDVVGDFEVYENGEKVQNVIFENNIFTFENLSGRHEYTIKNENYSIETVQIDFYNSEKEVFLDYLKAFTAQIYCDEDDVVFKNGDETIIPTSASNGVYLFDNLRAEVEIRVEKEGYLPFYCRFNANNCVATVDLEGVRFSKKIRVICEDEEVFDATVLIDGYMAIMDDGYLFTNLRGDQTLYVLRDGYQLEEIQIQAGDSLELNVVLKKLENTAGCNSQLSAQTFNVFWVLVVCALFVKCIYRKNKIFNNHKK